MPFGDGLHSFKRNVALLGDNLQGFKGNVTHWCDCLQDFGDFDLLLLFA